MRTPRSSTTAPSNCCASPPTNSARTSPGSGPNCTAASTSTARAKPEPVLRDRTVILVDDGLATGVTARAALRRIRAQHPARTILAIPVCSARTAEELRREADQVVCLQHHQYLHAVGVWYEDFAQVPDHEVIATLEGREANR